MLRCWRQRFPNSCETIFPREGREELSARNVYQKAGPVLSMVKGVSIPPLLIFEHFHAPLRAQ